MTANASKSKCQYLTGPPHELFTLRLIQWRRSVENTGGGVKKHGLGRGKGAGGKSRRTPENLWSKYCTLLRFR